MNSSVIPICLLLRFIMLLICTWVCATTWSGANTFVLDNTCPKINCVGVAPEYISLCVMANIKIITLGNKAINVELALFVFQTQPGLFQSDQFPHRNFGFQNHLI